jgi:hypothetical protein
MVALPDPGLGKLSRRMSLSFALTGTTAFERKEFNKKVLLRSGLAASRLRRTVRGGI